MDVVGFRHMREMKQFQQQRRKSQSSAEDVRGVRGITVTPGPEFKPGSIYTTSEFSRLRVWDSAKQKNWCCRLSSSLLLLGFFNCRENHHRVKGTVFNFWEISPNF